LQPIVCSELVGVTISNFPKGMIFNEWAILPGRIPDVRALDLFFEPYDLLLL
jgi:hypothetical protein